MTKLASALGIVTVSMLTIGRPALESKGRIDDFGIVLDDGNGGARLSLSCPDHIVEYLNFGNGNVPVNPFSLSMFIVDQNGNGISGIKVWRDTALNNNVPYAGGHAHAGSFGTLDAGTKTTDGDGRATFTMTPTSNAAGLWYPGFRIEYEGDEYTLQSCNAVKFALNPDGFDWLSGNDDFVLVGSTTSHPDNHYASAPFGSLLETIAADYHAETSLRLAYNDSALVWAGKFDLSTQGSPSFTTTSHQYHHLALAQDVRANGGDNSIPFDGTIRLYFELECYLVTGFVPLHESINTANEHYHICGHELAGPCAQ